MAVRVVCVCIRVRIASCPHCKGAAGATPRVTLHAVHARMRSRASSSSDSFAHSHPNEKDKNSEGQCTCITPTPFRWNGVRLENNAPPGLAGTASKIIINKHGPRMGLHETPEQTVMLGFWKLRTSTVAHQIPFTQLSHALSYTKLTQICQAPNICPG